MSADDDRSLRERFVTFLDSIGLENLTDDYREQKAAADEKLERTFEVNHEEVATLPEVAEVDKVNVHRDGEDILVPVIPVVFEEAGEPEMRRVWEVTGDVLRALHPVFETEHVRHYDIQFGYANADETDAVFRRITVSQPLTDEFVTDATVGIDQLQEQVRVGDDGDDGVPPVYWQEFDAYSPAGSGSYTGPAPIYTACSQASSSAVSRCLHDDDDFAAYAGTAGI